ncbi:CoA transferase [Steroidobacter flavus]|uniref:CoA transferase n=1 Tax=Steroidobacter flavus TaxID=1842136 RepID=A0ABV8T6H0_9GAMM
MAAIAIPLASCADEAIRRLATATGSAALADLSGQTLLGERAMLAGMRISGRVSAGGGCRLFDALDDTIALNLSRVADRELLPALFETEPFDSSDDATIAALVSRCHAESLVMRGRSMGLAISAEHETRAAPSNSCDQLAERTSPSTPRVQPATGTSPSTPCIQLAQRAPSAPFISLARGCSASASRRARPRVVDFSALWAGPLASHLLWLAGADVIKVESRKRPDAMRNGDSQFYSLLNQGKSSVVVDLSDHNDRQALRALISTADIVIEASRPRALAQLGFDAMEIVATTPGLVWITITGHGATNEPAGWVGFGDDCSVAAGLSAALRVATGRTGFVGDAIGDPLTGIFAADAAWRAWESGVGGRIGIALSDVVAYCLARCREHEPEVLSQQLIDWNANVGAPFPTVARRSVGNASLFGEHTQSVLARVATC